MLAGLLAFGRARVAIAIADEPPPIDLPIPPRRPDPVDRVLAALTADWQTASALNKRIGRAAGMSTAAHRALLALVECGRAERGEKVIRGRTYEAWRLAPDQPVGAPLPLPEPAPRPYTRANACAGAECQSPRADGSRWCTACGWVVALERRRLLARVEEGRCGVCCAPTGGDAFCGRCARLALRWPAEAMSLAAAGIGSVETAV